MICRLGIFFFLKKLKNVQKNANVWVLLHNATLWSYQNRTPSRILSRNDPTFFIFICLVSQIIIVLERLRKGNCQLSLVKYHKGLKETESFVTRCSSKKLFWNNFWWHERTFDEVLFKPGCSWQLYWKTTQSLCYGL